MKSLSDYTKIPINEYNIDKEMEIWNKRSNDSFGKPLHQIHNIIKNYEDQSSEYGQLSPCSEICAGYDLDGNKKITAKRLLYYLFSYDLAYVNDSNNELDSDIAGLMDLLQLITMQAKLKNEDIIDLWNATIN